MQIPDNGFAFWDELSHDLRGPFHSILGFAEVMRAGAREPLTDGQKVYVDMISDSAAELYQLLNAALLITRLRLRDPDSEVEQVDLRDLVDGAINMIRAEFFADSTVISFKRNGDRPVRIACDGTETESGFAFLLTAASTSVGEGRVEVSLERASETGGIRIKWLASRGKTDPGSEGKSLIEIIDKPTGIRERIISLSMNAGRSLLERQEGRILLDSAGNLFTVSAGFPLW